MFTAVVPASILTVSVEAEVSWKLETRLRRFRSQIEFSNFYRWISLGLLGGMSRKSVESRLMSIVTSTVIKKEASNAKKIDVGNSDVGICTLGYRTNCISIQT